MELFKLKNPVKHYPWGSIKWLPELLGHEPDGQPWAELWMGIHSEGESQTSDGIPIRQLVVEPLPFLFKVLAAAQILSIQAHPTVEQAQEGFKREEAAHIALTSPDRNYKDPNHKPEIICALSPFRALCGFRDPLEIASLMSLFSTEAASKPVYSVIQKLFLCTGIQDFFESLLMLSTQPHDLNLLYEYLQSCVSLLMHKEPTYAHVWQLCAQCAKQYPEDPLFLAPLYLNVIDIEPGEALYIPAGVLHAYVYGLGIELMANSDNVLRCGLTHKRIDRAELFKVVQFSPFKPAIIHPTEAGFYQNPSHDFSLCVQHGTGEQVSFPFSRGPAFFIVTNGVLTTLIDGRSSQWCRGESAFIPQASSHIKVAGTFTVYIAGLACENIG
ncbi:MAG: mannose-6-phosphate isomerase, class I [Treponema sp.]|jgi:mannose-6-phosphate isomerase|nr:mannose-6-phosphate isomerase, class I [Treponema sp.]